jgi:hypothetical protein
MADCIMARAGAAPHRREQGPPRVTGMTAPASSPSLAGPYFDAWNAHHPEPDRKTLPKSAPAAADPLMN